MPLNSSTSLFLIGSLAFWANSAEADLIRVPPDAARSEWPEDAEGGREGLEMLQKSGKKQWPEADRADVEGLDMLQMRSHKLGNVNANQPPLSQFPMHNNKLEESNRTYFHSVKDLEDTIADCLAMRRATLESGDGLLQQLTTNTADHASNVDHMSEQEILIELQQARTHVATLEALLAISKMKANNASPKGGQAKAKPSPGSSSPRVSTPSQRFAKLVGLCTCFLAFIAYAVRSVVHYERERDEFEEPWFHNSLCLTKVLLSIAFNWMIFGIYCFTEITLFTDAGRHLTTTEAIYLNSQIITTIGYGELTPTTQLGVIFMMFYCIIAVMLFGMKAQHFVMWYMEMSGDVIHVSSHSTTRTVAPILLCWAFGTFFYGYSPGEDKTIWECMYMSVITFLTIGFGDYHPDTQFGQLIGAVWMIVGVVLTGKAILDFTKHLYHRRRNLRSQAAATKAFNDIDKTQKGRIDKIQFLGFACVQEGFKQTTFDKALAKFDEFDLEQDGTLDFKQFKAYVDSVEVL